ncbi:MAG: SspB family protein [Caulobacteraceae bacterium]
MPADKSPIDLMNYEALAQDALRGVVKAALKRAASPQGIPGDHHFYISFRTGAPGVSGPAEVLSQYPEEMTIVLQHQYWDLAPGETFFSVTLQFGGKPSKLSIPYAAVTRFYDPSVQFLLQFEVEAATFKAPVLTAPASDSDAGEDAEAPAAPESEVKVVSLDQFRKK